MRHRCSLSWWAGDEKGAVLDGGIWAVVAQPFRMQAVGRIVSGWRDVMLEAVLCACRSRRCCCDGRVDGKSASVPRRGPNTTRKKCLQWRAGCVYELRSDSCWVNCAGTDRKLGTADFEVVEVGKAVHSHSHRKSRALNVRKQRESDRRVDDSTLWLGRRF